MTRPLAILCIEDSSSDFRLIERVLGQGGLTVRCRRVDRDEDIATALHDGGWDLVLADYRVPGVGFEACLDRIRGQFPELPLILVSGSVGEERAVDLLKQGVWDFVLKDNLIRLVPVIERSLREAEDRAARRASEVALRESEANYRTLVNNLPLMVWCKDVNSVFVACNSQFSAFMEIPEQEFIGRTDFDFFPPENAARYRSDDQRVMNTGVQEVFDERFVLDAEERHLRITRLPLRDGQGTICGVLGMAEDLTGRRLTERRLREATSRIERSESQLEHLVHYDPLTHLPNRRLLQSLLAHAIDRAKRDGRIGALLLLDLDRFKDINDSLGHRAGDRLLQLVASRFRPCLGSSDILARLGGDEFGILLENLAELEDAATVARSLIGAMADPFPLNDGQDVFISTSIGISIFPDDGDGSDCIIRNADAALYGAKRGDRGTFRFYTAALSVAANARFALETRLRHGLARQEFVLHYQPLMSMPDRRILGAEALVRWQDGERGLVLPGHFIPLAEETGLIVVLGDWVLRTACQQMKLWLDEGLALDTIAVNLSPLQFRQPDIAQAIRLILEETGLAPQHLELEITEGALMEFGLDAEAKLAALKRLGVRLAIDDFGTGYSSLAYLKRFSVDRLKIDQSFVRNIPDDRADMAISAAVIGLAKNLNMQVLAEGVETEAQFAYLNGLGCHAAQGFLFSRPVVAAEFYKLWRATAAGGGINTAAFAPA